MKALERAVFLDRDGVINKWEHGDKDVPESWYILKWDDFEFLPGVIMAIRKLLDSGYVVIVISNQSGIGRGFVDSVTVSNIFHRMKAELLGIEMSGWFAESTDDVFMNSPLFFHFCPHTPDSGCACRKPSPGMLYKAAIEHDIDLSKSWMVGDSDTDMEAGKAAGIKKLIKIDGVSNYIRGDLLQAVTFILEQEAE